MCSFHRCKAVSGHPEAVSISLEEPKPCEYRLSVESAIVCNLLTNVDEDGLPELLSPANGHRPKTSAAETKETQEEKDGKEDAPAAAAVGA